MTERIPPLSDAEVASAFDAITARFVRSARIILTCLGCDRSTSVPAHRIAVVLDDDDQPVSALHSCERCGARQDARPLGVLETMLAAGARLVDAATAAAHMHPSRGDQP